MTWNFYNRLRNMGSKMRTYNSKNVVFVVETGEETTEEVTIPASLGKTLIEEVNPTGGSTIGSRRDYIVTVADLLLADSTPFIPIRGMPIIDGDLVCQVASYADGGIFKYTTETRDRMRIHAVVVANGPD
jgi:hypothetical protein